MRPKHLLLSASALVLPLCCALWAFPAAAAPRAEPSPRLQAEIESALAHRAEEARAKAELAAGMAVLAAAADPAQQDYDVHHYDLALDLDPVMQWLEGTVRIGAAAVADTIDAVVLDLSDEMIVDGTAAGGASTSFSRAGDLLTVQLDRPYAAGDTFSVTIDYLGNPAGQSFGWDQFEGEDLIWTLSEPFGAREWWPCKDVNTDKADSLDIRVTVPSELIVASNGLLQSDSTAGDRRTFHWRTRHPIATYLVSVTAHPYAVFTDWYTPLDGGPAMPVQNFVFPGFVSLVEPNLGLTPQMLTVFAEAFGEYPFVDEKYGHAQFDWGGGMEHQTITSFGAWSEDLISHELAHQWWGDDVTCADFHHIWLNEGFAVWCEAFWKERTEGVATYRAYMDAAAYYGAGTIHVPDLTDWTRIFDWNLTYNKSSWVVHMLRGVLGDDDFFAGLSAYRAAFSGGSATTEQFRDVMEQVSGRDLDAFFQQWIYREYYPIYDWTWRAVPLGGSGRVDIEIRQIQDWDVFAMPVPVRVTTDRGVFDFKAENDAREQGFSFPVSGVVLDVELDPDGWILCGRDGRVAEPAFDRGVLVVNAVPWDVYYSELEPCYVDSVFSGGMPFAYWEASGTSGMPLAQMPAPAGYGPVDGGSLGGYSTVVWVAEDHHDSIVNWISTPILPYLEAGGDLIVLTREGRQHFDIDLTARLGVSWDYSSRTISECLAREPGLADMAVAGAQDDCDLFQTSLAAGSTLLFSSAAGLPAELGAGVLAEPPSGGIVRVDGGKLIYLAGRPTRYDPDDLKANVSFLLASVCGEPYTAVTSVPDAAKVAGAVLLPNHPNPFNPRTVIPFALAEPGRVDLAVYDVAGRLVRSLLRAERGAGDHSVIWDGTAADGRPAASGIYLVRLRAAGSPPESRLMTLVR